MKAEEIFYQSIVMLKNKKLFFQKIIIFFLLLLFFLRIVNIEADILQPYLVDYSSTDEGIYANLALNLKNWGSLMHPQKISGVVIQNNPQVILDIVGNLVTYFFLFIFGDNYYGFRLGIVFTAFFSLVFIVLSVKKLKKKYKIKGYYLEIITLLFLDTSFIFYSASRVVEPTIFRLFFSSLIIYIYIKIKRNTLKSFMIGLFTSISIFLVYVNNIFLIIGVILYILVLFLMKQYKEAIQNIVYGLAGLAMGGLISEIYYFTIWHTEALKNLFEVVKSFNSNNNYTIVIDDKQEYYIYFLLYIKRAVKFFSSNLFFYSLPILSLVMASLYNVKGFFHKKRKDYFFCLSMIVALFIQTLISEDFINRKSIVLLPFIVYICVDFIILYQKEEVRLSLYEIGEISFINLCIVFQKIYFPFSGYSGFNVNDKVTMFLYILTSSLIFLLISSKKFSYKLLMEMFLIFCLGNILFIHRYYFRNVYFYDKKMMVSLKKYGDQIILGEYINGYTLYNDIKPIVANREEIRKLMNTGDFKYYFDYSNVKRWLEIEFGKGRLVLITKYKRSTFNQFGNSDMGIYKILKKQSLIWGYRRFNNKISIKKIKVENKE